MDALRMTKLGLMVFAIVAVSTITMRFASSNGLPHHFFSKVGTVKVYCGYNTIGRALKRFPLKALVIVVKGTCAEDVVIERGRVTLMAETTGVDGVVGQADGGAAIKVAGAQNVVIDGLHVRSAPGKSSAAVFVTGNGEATVKNVLIDESGYGIQANHGGFVLLQASEIRNVREYGLLLSDAANARIENSVVEINDAGLGGSAAIGAFRTVNIRLRGANQIRNNGEGFSLDLFHNVEIRQDGGHTTFTGPLELGNLSHGSLRDPEITGGIDLFGGSRLEIRDSTIPGAKEIAGGHHLGVFGNSQLELRSGVAAEVGPINVHEHSVLDLGRGVIMTSAGHANLDASMLNLGDNSSLTIDEDVFLGRTGVHMGEGARMVVGGDLGAFSRVDFAVFGPSASLEVAGSMIANAFLNLNVGPYSTLTVNNGLQITDFSLMYAERFATIFADIDFRGSVTKVNFHGDGVKYNGYMQLSPTSSMDFGPNNSVVGSINCNGGDFSAQPGFDHSGATIMNCLSWP